MVGIMKDCSSSHRCTQAKAAATTPLLGLGLGSFVRVFGERTEDAGLGLVASAA
jgi:hypothetical protein